jgi:hypothetical protein
MVRRSDRLLGRPSDDPPPPPYKAAAASPLIVAETTTTTTEVVTTTTTQTTTHFFSSPWNLKRRGTPIPSSPRQSTSASSTVVNGSIAAPELMPGVLRVDKDLPPIPSEDLHSSSQNETHSEQQSSSKCHTKAGTKSLLVDVDGLPQSFLSASISRKETSPPSPFPSHPTSALAHAALGLGLPHVMPRASPISSSTSEINTVAFVTSPSHSSPRRSNAHLGQFWSAQRPKANSSSEKDLAVDKVALDTRRSRGISFGASLLNLGNDSKKQKEHHSPSKPLSRRASFWSRKKNASSADTSPLPAPAVNDFVPLPLLNLHTGTLFDVDLRIPSPDSISGSTHTRGLSRSHSDRARPRETSATVSNNTDYKEPVPKLCLLCPTTTDSLALSRPHSFIDGSSSMGSVSDASCPSQGPDPPNKRPRAYTNPPLLHGLPGNVLLTSLHASSPVGSATSPNPSYNRTHVEVVKPQIGEESPEIYLHRLSAAVSKAEIATILASR